MIHERQALSLAESMQFIDKDKNPEFLAFAKKFSKIELKAAQELKEKLVGLEMIKLRDVHISKIIDLLPKDKEDLLKVFTDVDLDEEETNTLLEIIKEYK